MSSSKYKGCRDMMSTRKECSKVFEHSLVWAGEIGANDYGYSSGPSVPWQTIQKLTINSVTGFLEAILKKGTKYVVVQGLPPSGCLSASLYLSLPDDRDKMGCAANLNKKSYTHNLALQSHLESLRKRFPESKIYADLLHGAYKTVVINKEKYGFKELFEACCGYGMVSSGNFDFINLCRLPKSSSCVNPSKYVNWEGVHLTEAMYKVVACKPPLKLFVEQRDHIINIDRFMIIDYKNKKIVWNKLVW